MLHITLNRSQVIVNGEVFPLTLPKKRLLEKLKILMLASSGEKHPQKIGGKFLQSFGKSLCDAILPDINLETGPIVLDIQDAPNYILVPRLKKEIDKYLLKP